jgi:paraquat-inducible protein B
MKDKKIKKLIQKPLRFHHQDIHEELDEIKGMLKNVSSQMQELQQRIDSYIKVTGVRLPK